MIVIQIDFSSDKAIYQQLRDQIIMGIASNMLQEGDVLPSVRQMAENIGINMHTVNKTYALLRQEGFIRLDRRRGAVVAIDADKLRAAAQTEQQLRLLLAGAFCRNITREEIQAMVDRIYDDYEGV